MKNLFTIMLGVLMMMVAGCSNNDLYEDMPGQIQSFISQYYPNSQLDNFTSSKTSYSVIIKNGPTIVFDSDCNWTRINGNGSTLPQVLLFNDLPPVLYSYLQETENTNNVFAVSRNSKEYVVTLLKYTITYNISNGEITGTEQHL